MCYNFLFDNRNACCDEERRNNAMMKLIKNMSNIKVLGELTSMDITIMQVEIPDSLKDVFSELYDAGLIEGDDI